MRDRKELIDILECCHEDDCGHCPAALTDGRPCNGATELSIPVPVFIFENVQELLKEQEPVKPIRLENWWKCPSCGGNIVANMKYCPRCGKAVKWE